MTPERRRLRVTGTVQGVGFRPFVYREAVELGLAGFVRNDSAGVLIDVEGSPERIAELCRRLVESPPPLARVERVDTITVTPATVTPTTVTPASHSMADLSVASLSPGQAFVILESDGDGPADVPVSVDTGTCDECLAEVDDPADRRHGYPFTNCTNCGPRYTIVVSVPYDRPATTMAGFSMCAACQREYDDPADRRFHAQPNACERCGPRLRYLETAGAGTDRAETVRAESACAQTTTAATAEGPAALDLAVEALDAGAVLALKGLGGYHLAVDAANAEAVAELRRRKRRDDKPFALMVRDVRSARRLVELDALGEAALSSARRPIVLAPRRHGAAVADAVAPGLGELGVMLPYTPLHHLVLSRLGRPLVLTSGNLSDEPIAHHDNDAIMRLGPLVDAIVTHDRPIHIRCDDSVVRATSGGTQLLRRSRGFAPEPLALPFAARRQVLAVGAQLKNTVSVAKGRAVVASHHIGDLEHLAAYEAFLQAIEHLCGLYGVTPEVVAHDLHPEYLSTKLATDLDLPSVGVQHHHAHIASCLVDHQRTDPVLGIAYDGHGYGPDATLWGGELIVADLDGYERAGHLLGVPLLGGAAAIKEPWRMALAWARQAGGHALAASVGERMGPRAGAVLALAESPATVLTSSVGRLFDAVAALLGVRDRVTYEGQAAIELEALAAPVPIGTAERYPVEQHLADGQLIVDPSPLVSALIEATPGPLAAAAFHESLGLATADAAITVARARDIGTVALTGGVFQNARLSRIVAGALRDEGLEVLVHRSVPPNDGGISVGQAAVVAHRPA